MPEEDSTHTQPVPADATDDAETAEQAPVDEPMRRHTATKLDLEIGADSEAEQSEQRLRAFRQAQQMPTEDDA